jgi:hypothetical protein
MSRFAANKTSLIVDQYTHELPATRIPVGGGIIDFDQRFGTGEMRANPGAGVNHIRPFSFAAIFRSSAGCAATAFRGGIGFGPSFTRLICDCPLAGA